MSAPVAPDAQGTTEVVPPRGDTVAETLSRWPIATVTGETVALSTVTVGVPVKARDGAYDE